MKLFVFFLLAVFLLGCTAPVEPVASPSPTATTTVLPTPTASSTPEPSPSPAALPSPTAPVVPTLAGLAATVGPLAQGFFNDTQAIREASAGVWVVGNDFAFYRYTVTVQDARRLWVQGDALSALKGENQTVQAQVITDTADRIFSGVRAPGTFYGYAALLKCFGQKYDVQLVVQDYTEIKPEYYRDSLGKAFAAKLADVCPA